MISVLNKFFDFIFQEIIQKKEFNSWVTQNVNAFRLTKIKKFKRFIILPCNQIHKRNKNLV